MWRAIFCLPPPSQQKVWEQVFFPWSQQSFSSRYHGAGQEEVHKLQIIQVCFLAVSFSEFIYLLTKNECYDNKNGVPVTSLAKRSKWGYYPFLGTEPSKSFLYVGVSVLSSVSISSLCWLAEQNNRTWCLSAVCKDSEVLLSRRTLSERLHNVKSVIC